MGGNALDISNNVEGMVEFLREASRYFKNRDTNGEDRAYWANIYNAENCDKIADFLLDKCSKM